MKKTYLSQRFLIILIALLSALVLGSCGGAKATSMHLNRTEGTVSVRDGAGKDVAPAENLNLYSGYGVGTGSDSYAWIDLDQVKLTKLDQDSQAEIVKEDKYLEIQVKTGSLFFQVTEPLAEDETMEIRSSSMMAGIRGTCGWTEVPDPDHMNLYLLEGSVECRAGEQTSVVNAGEMAAMSADGEIIVRKLQADDVPAFVSEEVADTDNAEIADTLELLRQQEEELALQAQRDAARRAALEGILYYGDPETCIMTAQQATELANAIGERMAAEQKRLGDLWLSDLYSGSYAALFDPGCGVPALLFTSATQYDGDDVGELPSMPCFLYYTEDGLSVKETWFHLHMNHLTLGESGGTDGAWEAYVFTDGQIPDEPSTTSSWELPSTYVIDGAQVSGDEYSQWIREWLRDGSLAHVSIEPDGSWGEIAGLAPAEDVIAALNSYAAAAE